MNKTSSVSQTPKSRTQNAVIIGGGPAGIATALMLAKQGWTNITVIEKRPSAAYYEPDKSFSYQIDGRGQKLTDYLGITEALAKVSVASTDFYLTRIEANGQRKTSKLPIVDPNRKTAYWLPRKTFLFLLYQEIEEHWSDKIQVLFQTSCVEINRCSHQLEVVTQDENGTVSKFEPNLLVGCDGLNSIVRKTLDKWDETGSGKFQMKCYPSPSSGLRYKVLTLPPSFPLDRNGEEESVSDMAYAIRGKFRDRQRFFSLGVLPVKNRNEPRTANIITRPNHKIWELNNSEEVYHFLQESFPQLAIEQIVSTDEIERFAASDGGRFPVPQYCSGFYFLLGEDSDKADMASQSHGSGVILLGDAIHCFPPDIGQGVNSALEDVYVLQ
jgi:kynurenine 3-monooxygenase